MRSLACLVCGCVLLFGCACSALQAVSAYAAEGVPVPDSEQSEVQLSPMLLAEGTSPLTGLPLQAGQNAVRRPLGVILDNVRVALPQRGLANASLVYEVVAESGITRLLAIYDDYTKLPEVGPVRSARDPQVQLAIPLGAMLLHVGGSTYATDMLEIYHYGDRSINGYYETGALELDTDRNATVAIEHCWFTGGSLFGSTAVRYGLSTQMEQPQTAFQFVPHADAPRKLANAGGRRVTIRFSSYDTTVLTYNPAPEPAIGQEKATAGQNTTQNSGAESAKPDNVAIGAGVYEKWQFDAPQIDENTGETLAFTNVLVLFAEMGQYPDGVLAQVDMTSGTGFYICGGRYEPVRWHKGLPEQPLLILTQDGANYVEINPGTTYVAVVDLKKEKYFTIESTD